ncbi:MAG: beta-N-acetylhexosaminidase [Bacillota bacterium]
MNHNELDLLLGQMFIFGFHGRELGAEIIEEYPNYPVGGIILFRRNVESIPQVQRLTQDLKEMGASVRPDSPLLIAVDQEGGNLSPLRGLVTSLPGNMGLAATGEPSAAYFGGWTTGNDLRSLGVNLSLTPVLDLALYSNPVVSTRAFSDKPEVVAAFGREYAKGLLASGILFTAKHFPGHGSCTEDSHIVMPVCKEPAETLIHRDVVPFLELMKVEASSLMMAHVKYLNLDPENPASLSPRIINGFLREQLGYKGVILTDCMEMNAIQEFAPYPEDAVKAIEAGVDIVIISHTPEHQKASYQAARNAVKSGRIKISRIEESVARINEWKKYIGKVNSQSNSSFWSVKTLAERVITLHDDCRHWQFDTQPLILITPEMGSATFAEDFTKIDRLETELREMAVACARYNCSENPSDIETEGLIQRINSLGIPKVAFVVSNILDSPGQIRLIEKLAETKQVLLISTRDPRELVNFGVEYPKIFIYSTEVSVLKALAAVISGKIKAQGIMPISFHSHYTVN